MEAYDKLDYKYAKILKKELPELTFSDLLFFPTDYVLRCVNGYYQGRQVRLKSLGNEIIIGSSDKCNLNIKSSNLSDEHCKLKYIDETIFYTIEDLNSETGTWKKISNLENYFEIKRDYTEFIFFDYKFFIEKTDPNSKTNSKYKLRFINNISKDNKNNGVNINNISNCNFTSNDISLEDGCDLTIGKQNCVIELDIPTSENQKFNITNHNNKVYISNTTEEITNDGLFYKINTSDVTLLRAGDVIMIGNCHFRLLVHNWGITTELGNKNKQEDRYCIVDDLRIFDEVVVPFYAVYDGHGGFYCSEFLQKNFHKNIKDIIGLRKVKESKNILVDLANAIQEAVIYTDFSYYKNSFSAPNQGSTCVATIFIANKILCCNLGDSIAILNYKKDDIKVFLSKDFKPTREIEIDRLRSKNAKINNEGRLLGDITVSRSFGDWRYKDPTKPENVKKVDGPIVYGEYTMSNRPEFRIFDIDPSSMDYVIIVSDGVFQYSSYQSVFDIINKYLEIEKDDNINNLINIPTVTDNVRLDIINKIHGGTVNKRHVTADNMTLILVHLNNDNYLHGFE